ncbi:hypothetical protein HanHA300_Chr15g0559561 [Helianthus annuus]|nr:hypothetical protein HanHA300_Chr15g0559561 [Helianthus annuus]KAJ0454985.1 hypothetical protein HanIR_Chr15g0746121 [Helianthus annuus]KAJ0648189.1 hypothetical protein HanLR1_Chr15g0570091 [Helianthus annuus]
MQSIERRLAKYIETTRLIEAKYEGKQRVLNQYIDELAKVNCELAEKEKKINKLQSYHASSHILERIFNIKPHDNGCEKNKKGIGSEYLQIPPPLENNYTSYDDEKVTKVINMVDQLPENIDVTYTKSDVGESKVVNKVVESVLKDENDSTKTEISKSQNEDEESFHKNYLKNSKSESDTKSNDDPILLAYLMVGSDKLFSDDEFPIHNVIVEKVERVFKLVEIEKSKIEKLGGKTGKLRGKKTFYNKPSYKKKNTNAVLGYKKKQNQKKRAEKINFQKMTNFVHETSSEEEKEIRFSRQTNEEFFAQKKKQQQAKDVSK